MMARAAGALPALSAALPGSDGKPWAGEMGAGAARKPLAELPPVFSKDRMRGIVQDLASDALQGRGLGTPELDRAGELIAKRFSDAGLVPGGTKGSWFQEWQDPERKVAMRNVIGVIPGADPGRPGQSVMATLGIISALKKEWRTPAGGQLDYYLQTDALMYPGFSGGPLVSAAGKFIGLNTSAMLRDVTLTIPAGTIRRVAEALLRHGRVKRGYLGVGAQTVRLPKAIAEQAGQETGLLLGSVEAGSPAERSGLFMGDTLLSLAGQRTAHLDDLLAALSGDRVGQTVPARILRGGQVTEANVMIGGQG